MRHRVAFVEATAKQGPSAMHAATIGLDLAQSVFQVHCAQGDGEAERKKVRQAQGMEFFRAQPPSFV
jgi:hypothetical protein